jgi:Adaptive response protein AidB N-terminal domain
MAAVAGGFEAASFNQTPPFENIDLFATDLALCEAVSRGGADQAAAALSAFGRDFGSAATMGLGRSANENPPRLRIVDATGTRADLVDGGSALPGFRSERVERQSDKRTRRAALWRLRSKPGISAQPP